MDYDNADHDGSKKILMELRDNRLHKWNLYQDNAVIIGVHGQNGEDGTSGIIVSPTPPENPKRGQLWQTASGEPIKRWDGSRWVLHYVSVENLDVQTLSAIAVNAGELTAGKIKSKNGIMLIDIDAGKIVSKLIDNGVVDSTMELNSASLAFSGKDSGGNPAKYHSSMQGLAYINQNTGGRSKLVLSDGDIYAQNGSNPLIGLSSYSKYDSGTKQGPFPEINPSNSIRIKLIRTAFVANAHDYYESTVPVERKNQEIQEVRIPDGYRPARASVGTNQRGFQRTNIRNRQVHNKRKRRNSYRCGE